MNFIVLYEPMCILQYMIIFIKMGPLYLLIIFLVHNFILTYLKMVLE